MIPPTLAHKRRERRHLRKQAPMAYRLQRQGRPSLLRAYWWRALQSGARVFPSLDLGLTSLELPLPGLPRDLDGLTILHVTDLHLSAGSHPADAIAPLLHGSQCDIVVYTGDLADDEPGMEPLSELIDALPPRVAAFAVLGNHDHYYYGHGTGLGPQPNDLAPLLNLLQGHGVEVLRNQHITLFDGRLNIVGIDDPALGFDDLDTAFNGADDSAATILLAHSPDVLVRLGDYHPGLLLAGHTHGGQLRLPGLGPIGSVSVLPRRYSMGVYTYGGVLTYVSRGVGTSGAPARFYCPPEVTIVTLRSP